MACGPGMKSLNSSGREPANKGGTIIVSAGVQPLDSSPQRIPWLFSPAVDIATFLGSALLALGLLAVGFALGILRSDAPEWTWISAILLIDVAHVYATGFRVYFDLGEFQRRRWLYILVPLLSFMIAAAMYSESVSVFWRVLAYMAVFHFVRQQYGFVAMYRAKAGETTRLGWWIDAAAVYMATLYPLLYWHGALPRRFWWFIENDFASLPALVAQIAAPIYWMTLALYFGRSTWLGVFRGRWNPGKDIVVASTAICWYVGIIVFNSDYAFTVTNVIIHGIPYMVLVFWFVRKQRSNREHKPIRFWQHLLMFISTIWLLAYIEELLWDRSLWHERPWLFGHGWNGESIRQWLVPLLVVPQVTHYILDGFIWRRRSNPNVAKAVSVTSED